MRFVVQSTNDVWRSLSSGSMAYGFISNAHSLLEPPSKSNALNLNRDSLRQLLDSDTAPGRFMRKEFLVDAVHLHEIGHVVQENSCLVSQIVSKSPQILVRVSSNILRETKPPKAPKLIAMKPFDCHHIPRPHSQGHGEES